MEGGPAGRLGLPGRQGVGATALGRVGPAARHARSRGPKTSGTGQQRSGADRDLFFRLVEPVRGPGVFALFPRFVEHDQTQDAALQSVSGRSVTTPHLNSRLGLSYVRGMCEGQGKRLLKRTGFSVAAVLAVLGPAAAACAQLEFTFVSPAQSGLPATRSPSSPACATRAAPNCF